MPISKSINVKNSRRVAIWKIEESLEDLIHELQPDQADKTLLFSFKNRNKQLEWLCGRLILKHLMQQDNHNYRGLNKDEHGKPFLIGLKYEISLTHSFPYVAAIVDHQAPVGIDLEQPREKVLRIAPKYCNEKELTYCENNVLKLNIIWSVKETLYKIYGKKGLSLKDQIAIDPFEVADDFILTGKIIANDLTESYSIRCLINNEYILTFNV